DYYKVLRGGEQPYIDDKWEVTKRLKRKLRLRREKNLDRKCEDRVWRMFFRMGYHELNRGHDFNIKYKADDKSIRQKQVDIFAKDDETVIVGEGKESEEYKRRPLSNY